ncbi:uncharacterized protein LOC128958257 [Oppia nitens]|uniref:uncharacterized protein LOC128958257 n=1 Tax=Oppia nitens TaxID=1686743 RepID=UPI0023DAC8F1|nr:uncharacterized protein LOC128958257 [Oppia nitens]
MSSIQSFQDSKFQNFYHAFSEAVKDNESTANIGKIIEMYFGSNTNQLANNWIFCHHLLFTFIGESLVPEESVNRFAINQRLLGDRSQLVRQFVHQYPEYQLNLILLLANIKITLQLTDDLFNELIKCLYEMRVISQHAYRHWYLCNRDFEGRVNAINSCLDLLDFINETRKEIFYENYKQDIE